MEPTQEQVEILHAAKSTSDNLCIVALAGTKLVTLTRGLTAIVDDDDYEKVTAFSKTWYAIKSDNNVWYAGCKKYGTVYRMHWLIIGENNGDLLPDHINRNGLDNRKTNLKWKTRSDSALNRGKFKNNTSGHVGVYFSVIGRGNKHWHAQFKRK